METPTKSKNRVHPVYEKYPDDWARQYNMLLDDGKTCSDCIHCQRCVTLFGQKDSDTTCQFYPNKFRPVQ